jgi:hypothetical protein
MQCIQLQADAGCAYLQSQVHNISADNGMGKTYEEKLGIFHIGEG